MKKIFIVFILIFILITGCNSKTEKILDSEMPITIRVWHYYNGSTQEVFDGLVNEFNNTIGMERGIVVESQSQGSVEQLATAVYDAASETIGSQPIPEIFATYSDTAFRVHELVDLISLDEIFSQKELSEYRTEFLDEGIFITDGKYYIMPIAKSSENLFINNTDWKKFANEYNLSIEDLKTWEGLSEVSELYYNKTGKAFFSLNANANFFIVGAKQLGKDIYSYKESGKATFNLSEEIAHKFWEVFIVPYLKGYYTKTGRFSSDDAKTGTVLAYTGSTAGSLYFPSTVSIDESNTYDIEPLVLPYPYFENGDPIVIQQGAGMSIVNTDEAHNLGAKIFLKWFTEKNQNIKFSVATGYFPVKNNSLKEKIILKQLELMNNPLTATEESIKTSIEMFENYKLYNAKAFEKSYEMRVLLDKYIYAYMNRKRKRLNEIKSDNINLYNKAIKEETSEKAFRIWYKDLLDVTEKTMQ